MRYGVLLLSVVGLGADSVTFDLAQYRDVRNAPVLVFSGTISSRGGGEYVEVLGRECRNRGERLISGVLTSGGGGWQVENPDSRTFPPRQAPVYSGMASPRRPAGAGSTGRPVTWRLPAAPQVARIGRTRTWVVHMLPATPTGQVGFQGKLVALQRQAGSRWGAGARRRGSSARRASAGCAFNYEARFRIPTRGPTLRAYLPAKSTAPCFLPGSSPTWRCLGTGRGQRAARLERHRVRGRGRRAEAIRATYATTRRSSGGGRSRAAGRRGASPTA